MKWYKTSEILPEKNRQLFLLISNVTKRDPYYEIDYTNIVTGVYRKKTYYKDFKSIEENECSFEGFCCNMDLSISDIIAWSYVPSVSEIEASFLNLQ